jgi:hypothetical protein
VSEAETLEEDEVVVPTVVPQIERDGGESDTATGPELFRDSVFGEHEEPAQVGTPVDGPTEVSIVDPWSGDGGDEARWPEDDAPDPGASWPEEADEQPFAASGDELEGDAEGPFTAEDESGDVAFLGSAEPQEAPAEPDAWDPVPEGWTAEVPPHLEHGLDETDEPDEIEPDFELVPEEPGPAIEEPSGADLGFLESTFEPEAAELGDGHGHEARSERGPLPGELFFVSDEEPFGEPFELLRDEPTATREVTAEGSALVAAPSARVSSVDVLPESNQLHVRLHGHGALAEYGQVRELDIMVPVPGQWIGNQRVTLQLRLTLTPSSEDEADGKG